MAKWDLSKLPEGRKPLPDDWFCERAQMQERIAELEAKLVDVTEEFDAIIKHDRNRIEELVSMVVGRDNLIEELEAKLAKEIEISNQRGNHIEFVLLPQMSDLHFKLKDVKAKLVEYKMVAGAIDKRWAESEDEVAELQAKLAELEPKDGRPCATDEFLAVILDELDDNWDIFEAIKDWVEGDWVNAVQGTALAELKGEK